MRTLKIKFHVNITNLNADTIREEHACVEVDSFAVAEDIYNKVTRVGLEASLVAYIHQDGRSPESPALIRETEHYAHPLPF